MAENKTIIIKKINKVAGGAHGGSWKVAYADFVTAMMAFFLLMWLINMTPQEKKEQLAGYFKEFSLFDKGGKRPIFMEEAGQPIPMKVERGADNKPMAPVEATDVERAQEAMVAGLRKDIEEKLADIKDQVLVDNFEGGVRIQIIHKEGHPIFEKGSFSFTPEGQRALAAVADKLKELPNRFAVEGHTDSLGYSDSRYTNWELSTARASSARLLLEHFGVPTDRLVRVAGYASTQPLVKGNPDDPRNRRISILIYRDDKAAGTAPAGPPPPPSVVIPETQAPALQSAPAKP
jgi:chemotaxis protein MotB